MTQKMTTPPNDKIHVMIIPKVDLPQFFADNPWCKKPGITTDNDVLITYDEKTDEYYIEQDKNYIHII